MISGKFQEGSESINLKGKKAFETIEGFCFVISVTYLIMPNTDRMVMMKKKIDCSFKNEFMWYLVGASTSRVCSFLGR